METRFSPGPHEFMTLNTQQLRHAFLVETLFAPGKVQLVYTDADRAVIGSATPMDGPLELKADAELRAQFFCERREVGILNIGGAGSVKVDGTDFELGRTDILYVGRGSKHIFFSTKNSTDPAAYYFLSYPAHTTFPTKLARREDAAAVELGSPEEANHRTIYKIIHPAGIPSCQLVMGFTELKPGSVWNTMPPHTHARRTEIYLYFGLGTSRRVMHFMGEPKETRHVIVSDRQAVISPSWSIHSGCGTGAYTFCWGMGGENQAFDDMDAAPLTHLR